MSILKEKLVLNGIPIDLIIRLCSVSKTIRDRCRDYLQGRIRKEFRNDSITLISADPSEELTDLIVTLKDSQGRSLRPSDIIAEGLERIIPLDEALVRATLRRNRTGYPEDEELIDYFLSLYPSPSRPKYIMDAVDALTGRARRGNLFDRRLNDGVILPVRSLTLLRLILSTLNITRSMSENLLADAAREGWLEQVRYLVEIRNIDPGQALFEAAASRRSEIVRYLAGKLDLIREEHWIGNAVYWASLNGLNHIADLLIGENLAYLNLSLIAASRRGDLERVKNLVERGADSIREALRTARETHRTNVVEYLEEL